MENNIIGYLIVIISLGAYNIIEGINNMRLKKIIKLQQEIIDEQKKLINKQELIIGLQEQNNGK